MFYHFRIDTCLFNGVVYFCKLILKDKLTQRFDKLLNYIRHVAVLGLVRLHRRHDKTVLHSQFANEYWLV